MRALHAPVLDAVRRVRRTACRVLPAALALVWMPLPGLAQQDSLIATPRLRPIHDIAGTAVDLARDFERTLTAPVRFDGRDWLVTGGVFAVGGILFAFDEDITRMAVRNRDAPVLEEFGDVGDFLEPIGLMGNTNAWYAAGAVGSYLVGWDRPKRLFTELLYSHWIAGAVRGGVNRVVGRARPHDGRGPHHFEMGNGTSFPSGHASTIVQVAAVLAHHADRLPVSIAVYGLASSVLWQRVFDEQHWASDVWLGAAYGWAVAELVVRLHEAEAIGIAPAVLPGGAAGVQLEIRF